MPSPLSAEALIAAVRRDGMLGPVNGDSFPLDSDILAWLNEEVSVCLVPMLMRPREERFVTIERFTTEEDVSEYDIPSRSTWLDVRDVQVLVPGSSPEQWKSLRPTPPEQANLLTNWTWFGASQPFPAGYYVQADKVVLFPPPPAPYEMRTKYFRRPARIVSDGYATPTAIAGSGTYAVTVATTGMTAGLFDLVAGTAPYLPILEDISGTVTDPTHLALTMSAADAAILTAALNDSLLIAAECAPIAQIPLDLAPLLSARGTYRAKKAKRSPDWKAALDDAKALQKEIFDAMTPRADGLPQTVVVTNAPGMGNGYGGGWGGFGCGGG